MTDQLNGIFGRAGTNDVSKLQLITYNAYLDQKVFTRKYERNPKYEGNTEDEAFSILQGEPCVRERRTKLKTLSTRSFEKESDLAVFSNIAGMGKTSDTKESLLKKLKWGGFKGYLTKQDRASERTGKDVMFTVYLGGLFSTCLYSDVSVYSGDLLYWDIPKDDAEAEKIYSSFGTESRMMRGSKSRRPVFLRPYRPGDHQMNLELLVKSKTLSDSKKTDDQILKLPPMEKGPALFLSILAKLVNTIANGGVLRKEEMKNKGPVLDNIYSNFVTEMAGTGPSPYKDMLQMLMDSVITTNDHVKGRVVAKAVSSAAPGQTLDIVTF